MIEQIHHYFECSIQLQQISKKTLDTVIAHAATVLLTALQQEAKILVCGNGGSAAQAQHFSAELLNHFENKMRVSLPVIALNADTATLTAIANDRHYDQIFARQIQGLGKPGDVLLLLTTSGNSSNLIQATMAARERQLSIIAITGRTGGQLATCLDSTCDIEIRVPNDNSAHIQETHMLILHCLCSLIDNSLL